jgi:hypothetical protein
MISLLFGYRCSRFLLIACATTMLLAGVCVATLHADDTEQAQGPLRILPPIDTSHEQPVTYQARQVVTLDQIKPAAKHVRMWVSIPGDEAHLRLLDFNVVSAPGDWRIVSDADRRGKFLYVEVAEPKADALQVEVAFTLRREPVMIPLDPATAGELTDGMRAMYAEHLALDAPHMEVTSEVRAMADEVCGDEANLAVQSLLLLQHVASVADHYSKNPNVPNCGIGDAGACVEQGGGCCTDLHSLFIALARARGIPARLQMGYRLQEKNRGKQADPGYRCWVEYFVPNYGWLAADIVEADAPMGLGPSRWLTGLTARRIWLNQGREFKLADDQAVERVNHMSIAYAEIDGQPARLLPEGDLKPQITRQVYFEEVPSSLDAQAAAN